MFAMVPFFYIHNPGEEAYPHWQRYKYIIKELTLFFCFAFQCYSQSKMKSQKERKVARNKNASTITLIVFLFSAIMKMVWVKLYFKESYKSSLAVLSKNNFFSSPTVGA